MGHVPRHNWSENVRCKTSSRNGRSLVTLARESSSSAHQGALVACGVQLAKSGSELNGRFAILGGGALGLTLALRLAQAGRSVSLFEQGRLPGGLAAGFDIGGGVWLEKFYHHLFRSDRTIVGLVNELGLSGKLEWRRPITATLRGGRVYSLDSPASLLRFSPLAFHDRLRMGACLAFLRTLPNASVLEGRPAEQWIRRYMGKKAHEVVWGPLLEGKFGAAASEIALPWFWARVHDRTAQLGYLRGGFQQLYDALAEMITAAGGTIHLGSTVETVDTKAGGFTVRYQKGEGAKSEDFERVVSTLPTRTTCRIVPGLPDAYRRQYEWGRSYGAHCLVLALKRPLVPGVYWLNINDPGFPFMALIQHTEFRDAREYGDRHLVYLGNYRRMDDELLTMPLGGVLEHFTPGIRKINPDFNDSWITQAWSFAAPFAQPIVTTDYREHIPPFDTPIAGLFVGNMFQVYPHDRGQNYSVQLAEDLARHLIGHQPIR